MPRIVPLLRSPDQVVRIQALSAVARIGGKEATKAVKEALLELTRALSSPDAAVRASAVHALGQLKEQARSTVPALLALLKRTTEEAERMQIALSLIRIGTPAGRKAAEEVIGQGLKSKDPAIRGAATAGQKLLRP